ncbi:MAG: hypothetical protein WCS37_08195 [Chloroflexota bacterium]|nr:hypothetical protein [Chloroflexota bacterium]
MPPISHNYLNKLRREVAAFDEWLANTQPQPDGSASVADLHIVFTRANALYLKALALYRTTDDDEPRGDDAGEATLSGS